MHNMLQINITIKLLWVWELINNSLIYIYFHACASTQDLTTCYLSFSLKLHIRSFFKRQRLDFDSENFLEIDHVISKSLFWSVKLQVNLESSLSFSCVRILNDIVWLLYLDLNSVSLIPKYTFVDNSLIPSMVSTSAL